MFKLRFRFGLNRACTLHHSILIKFRSIKTFSLIQSEWKLLHFERLLQLLQILAQEGNSSIEYSQFDHLPVFERLMSYDHPVMY